MSQAAASADLVSVIEAAYRPDGTDDAWLGRIVELVRPSIDAGLGATGFFYDLSHLDHMRIWAPIFLGTPSGAEAALDAVKSLVPVAFAEKLNRATPSCATMSERLGMGERVLDEPLHRAALAPLGVYDFLSVAATDPSGIGCLIGAPLPRVTRVPRRAAAVWNRIAAHIAAGSRLRRSLAREPEAILTPRGDMEHAADAAAQTTSAREALKRSAQEMDRARGRMRTEDPEKAVSIWTALVSGRWTLVDHFDHDGRRYVIARKNDPDVAEGKKALTRRERQVLAYAAMGHSNKLIAYELGLSPSTIAMHLSSAAAKLNVRSRVALIRAFQRSQ